MQNHVGFALAIDDDVGDFAEVEPPRGSVEVFPEDHPAAGQFQPGVL